MENAIIEQSLTYFPQKHVEVVLDQDIVDFSPLFTEIADTYFESNMFAEARRIYEMLGADASVSQH